LLNEKFLSRMDGRLRAGALEKVSIHVFGVRFSAFVL